MGVQGIHTWFSGIIDHDSVVFSIQLRWDLCLNFVVESLFRGVGLGVASQELDNMHGFAADSLSCAVSCDSSLFDCIFPISQSSIILLCWIKLKSSGRADHKRRNFNTICGW